MPHDSTTPLPLRVPTLSCVGPRLLLVTLALGAVLDAVIQRDSPQMTVGSLVVVLATDTAETWASSEISLSARCTGCTDES